MCHGAIASKRLNHEPDSVDGTLSSCGFEKAAGERSASGKLGTYAGAYDCAV